MRAIVNSEFGPVENVEYFLRTMLPKFILLLLKRGYVHDPTRTADLAGWRSDHVICKPRGNPPAPLMRFAAIYFRSQISLD
jgi:hypothetical protein